jgi:hypothetical protein
LNGAHSSSSQFDCVRLHDCTALGNPQLQSALIALGAKSTRRKEQLPDAPLRVKA